VTSIRTLSEADVHPLARLHRRAFPTFFLSSLGEPFLVEFYRGFLHDASAVAVVAQDPDGSVCGAAVGTLRPRDFYGRLLRRRWAGFVAASVRAVLAQPSALPRLLSALGYRGGGAGSDPGALLSSICVDPDRRSRGLGRQLLSAWTEQAGQRGAARAFLTTDAEANDAVNAFYRARGWQPAERFITRRGRAMYRYTIDLARGEC